MERSYYKVTYICNKKHYNIEINIPKEGTREERRKLFKQEFSNTVKHCDKITKIDKLSSCEACRLELPSQRDHMYEGCCMYDANY